MRVGLFTDAYLPDINGVVSSVATLKEALEQLGHTVYVITNHNSSKITLEDHVLRLPGLELKKFYGYKMSSPFQFAGEDYIRDMDLDVIHVQTEAGIGIFGRQMAKSLNLPLVYTYHTMYEDYTHYINPLDLETIERMGRFAIRSFSRILGNGAQAVVAPSEKTKEALIGYGVHTPIYIVPTGLDLSSFERSSLDEQKIQKIRQDCQVEKDDHGVVFLGRIAKEKMLEMPIRAMALSQDPKRKLIIVGKGTDEGYYKKMVNELGLNDRIIFTGGVPKEEVPYYYAAFDCFVSASTTETQGMTYIEALASGLPVFGRRDDVLKELIEEGVTGYYFDTEEELNQKWDAYFSIKKEERDQKKQVCIEKALPYNVEMFGHKMSSVYAQAIDDYESSYSVERIRMMDDFVQLSIQRDSGQEEQKIWIPLDDFFEFKIVLHTRLDAYVVENYKELQSVYLALQSAKNKVLSHDHTCYEITRYVQSHFDLDDDEARAVILALEEKGLLNDERYAQDKASVWHSYGKPRLQIERKLRKAGIDPELAQRVCQDLDEKEEMDSAFALAQRLKSTIKDQSNRLKRQNLINKLVTKGFSLDIARHVGEEIELEEEEEQALDQALRKAKRLYASFDEPKRSEKIRLYGLRKGFSREQIEQWLEGETE